MTKEEYIDHEVRLRVNDVKFKLNEERLKILNTKLNFLIGTGVTGIVIPVVLHYLKII